MASHAASATGEFVYTVDTGIAKRTPTTHDAEATVELELSATFAYEAPGEAPEQDVLEVSWDITIPNPPDPDTPEYTVELIWGLSPPRSATEPGWSTNMPITAAP